MKQIQQKAWVLLFFLFVLTGQVLATHTLTVGVETVPATINVDNEFDLNVFLSVPSGTADLWSAKLVLTKTDATSANFDFVSLSSPNLASSVFNPLTQNGLSLGNWVMEGDNGFTSSFQLGTTKTLLGKVRVKAKAAGELGLALVPSTSFAQAIDEVGDVAHTFDLTLSVDTITIGSGGAVQTFSCTGIVPSNAQLCISDDQELTANTARTVVSSCTDDTKCEYTCSSGFQLKDGSCQAAGTFTLTASDFSSGGGIPKTRTCDGSNLQPILAINNVPAGTDKLLLLMEDLNAQTGTDNHNFVHWQMLDIPSTTTGIGGSSEDTPAGASLAPNDFIDSASNVRQTSYGGPCPPEQDPAHRYQLTLYALSQDMGINDPNSDGVMSSTELEAAAGQLIVGKAALTGTYQRAPVCGNGVIGQGEQCDDGNTNNGDGCSSTCQTEAQSLCGNGQVNTGENCVTCPDDAGCSAGENCVGGSCQATTQQLACSDNADCATSTPKCLSGTCVQCTTDADCAGNADGNACIINKCTGILTTMQTILNDSSTSILQKISAIASALRTYFKG